MEPLEAAQRLRHHLGVIVTLFLVGLLIPFGMHLTAEDRYLATSRVLIGGSEVTDSTAARSVADTAAGYVTSPGRIASALKAAKVDRDPEDVARNVRIEPVGTSGVLELSVYDADRKAVAKITNALAEQLLEMRRGVVTGELTKLLDEVSAQMATVTEEIDALTQEISDAEVTGLGSVTALKLRYDAAVRNLSGLAEQRQRLLEGLALAPQPAVVDAAAVPDGPEPSGLVARLAVGGLLGLALGVGIAALLESVNPTILNPEALSRLLGAPVLGNLPRPPQNDTHLRDLWLPQFLTLAASGAGVRSARLVSLGPRVDLERLAGWLRDEVGSYEDDDLLDPPSPFPEISLPDLEPPAHRSGFTLHEEEAGPAAGLVVVSPRVIRRSDLAELRHQLAITRWPLLGIVSYQRRWTDPGPLETAGTEAPQPAVTVP